MKYCPECGSDKLTASETEHIPGFFLTMSDGTSIPPIDSTKTEFECNCGRKFSERIDKFGISIYQNTNGE